VDLGLQGKSVIVTGGASGIGIGIVEGFVKEGANTVIADIDRDAAQKLAEKMSGGKAKVIAVKTNVTSNADIENLVATTLQELGKIDILVNNAGVAPTIVEFENLTEKDWDRVNDVNTKGVFLVTRAVIPHMIKEGQGKIVNISSFAGKQGVALHADYCASKFAVIGITQSLAQELAEHNINVNAVCPGIVRTPMWDHNLAVWENRLDTPQEEVFDNWCQTVPLKRPQSREDIASVVVFLSSDATKNITGESVSINGGQRMD
jgi:meso-butanediol dehydrogenase/(S,S)-butanediol dehydrogenase/diacetyl reductase